MARRLRMLRVEGCPVWKNGVVASHHLLRCVTQMQAPCASQFGAFATAVGATSNRITSAGLGDFAVAATAGNL